MLNAGLIPLAVVDSHKAEFWAQVLPNIRLHPEAAVRTGGEIAWAFRKNSPQLAAVVNEFAAKHGKGTLFGNAEVQGVPAQHAVREGRLLAPRSTASCCARSRSSRSTAKQYDFDWLMLAAQGYQESRLDQGVKSRVGALGVMQVMPATGKELDVGDVREIEPNIHAGAKYLRAMMERYFSGAQLDGLNRQLFAFASYNAGPPDREAAQGSRSAGPRPERVVQQRRDRRVEADRPGDRSATSATSSSTTSPTSSWWTRRPSASARCKGSATG